MKPLVVLLVTFIVAIFTVKLIGGAYNFALAARIALSAMLLFTSVAHFIYTRGMTMMVPDAVPYKQEMVYATGFIEILAAVALQIPALKVLTGWLLILFFLLLLPANINAELKHIDYEKATYEGKAPKYLWFRVPLQILFILWTYFSCIRF